MLQLRFLVKSSSHSFPALSVRSSGGSIPSGKDPVILNSASLLRDTLVDEAVGAARDLSARSLLVSSTCLHYANCINWLYGYAIQPYMLISGIRRSLFG